MGDWLKLKCCFCGFEWNPTVKNPRACPGCKRYFIKEKPEMIDDVEKEYTRRLLE